MISTLQFQQFKEVLINKFNPSYLVSLLILSLFSRLFTSLLQNETSLLYFLILLPLINAGLTCVTVFGLNMLLDKLVKTYRYENKKQTMLVSFIAGLLTIYGAFSPLTSFFIFLLVIMVTVVNIREFLGKLGIYLEPNKIVTKEDLFNLATFFTSLTTAFIVINLTIQSLHNFFGIGQAFNFNSGLEGILDSVYFTFILMTTVGFGDIVPLTPFAKIIVSFECMTSYIMFALIIGIVNRGITKLN